ncbi:unnamed protein product [Cunninghamella echinulata]
MYNTTSVGLPIPTKLLKFKSTNQIEAAIDKCSFCKNPALFRFNVNPFATSDIYTYRKQRSEHLLFRILHMLEKVDNSFLRIDLGVFIVQQTKPNTQPQLTQPGILETYLSDTSFFFTTSFDDIASVFTFDQNNIPNLITNFNDDSNSNNIPLISPLSSSSLTSYTPPFTPFSYTVGIRYTKVGNQYNDALIQGSIPLWSQTLILHEYYKTEPPIKPNETKYGLIPFATHIPLYFQPISEAISQQDNKISPELLLLYERFNMDNTNHELYGLEDLNTQEWYEAREEILKHMVYCFIPSDLAQIITTLANEWVAEKGFIV